MKKYPAVILCLAFLLSATSANALPMYITQGTCTPVDGNPYSIDGKIEWFADEEFAQMFCGAGADIFIDGFDPIDLYSGLTYLEIQGVFEDHYDFTTFGAYPDPFGRVISGSGTAFYEAGTYYRCGPDPGPCDYVRDLTFQSVQMNLQIYSENNYLYSLDLFAEVQAVPEPATILLLGSGLLGLAGVRRRFKK